MNCDFPKDLVHAYADGELDLTRTLEVEAHLRDCPECATAHANILSLRSALGGGSLYARASGPFERRIRAQIRSSAAATAAAEEGNAGDEASPDVLVLPKPQPAGRRAMPGRWRLPGGWASAAAAAIVVAVGAWAWVATRGPAGGGEGALVAEVTSAHVRSLMADHLWDVKSEDRHTVKPWFDGKLDFAPDVRDLKADGFPLEGGRLDYLADRPVAALVYRYGRHEVNVFVWPAPVGTADAAPVAASRQGYALVHWVRAGMHHWAVADTGEDTLRKLAGLLAQDPPAVPQVPATRRS